MLLSERTVGKMGAKATFLRILRGAGLSVSLVLKSSSEAHTDEAGEYMDDCRRLLSELTDERKLDTDEEDEDEDVWRC